MQVLRHAEIDVLLDVGANVGQFARQIRRLGYSGHIVSFEPLAAARKELERAAAKDRNWTVAPYALGNEDGAGKINVTENLVSSSLLAQEELLTAVDPSSRVTGQQDILVRRLDSVFDEYVSQGSSVALKLDTQGYERQVLEGGAASIPRLKVMHFEVSLVSLYRGELLLPEALELMDSYGFSLATLEPGLPDSKTGQLLQVDLTMVRR